MSLNIVFAGTPAFAAAALNRLLSSHRILAVFTQPDRPSGRGKGITFSPVKELALKNKIPIYQPLRLKEPEVEILKALNPDVLVVAAYGLILPTNILNIPRLGCINIHASLLPKWRGAAPIQRAILANDKETGITIMQMDKGLDTGDILSMSPCPIEKVDTTQTLYDKLATLGAEAIVQTLEKLEQNTILPIKQEDKFATLAPKITKEEGLIDWNQTAESLDCKIRAFNPWPIAYTHINNQIVRIWAAKALSKALSLDKTLPIEQSVENVGRMSSDASPGTILAQTKTSLQVMTGQGLLELLELQLPNAKRLAVSEILKSKQEFFKPGTSFY